MAEIQLATPDDAEACVGILRQLPSFFTENTHDEVRELLANHRAWIAVEDQAVSGFLIVQQRYPRAAEIPFAAVLPERQGSGIGTDLVQHALQYLAEAGVALVEVKTLDASSGYEPYLATRAFWERRGFVQVDCIDPLPGWQPGNPSAIYVAALAVTGT